MSSGTRRRRSLYIKCGLSFFPAIKLKKSCCWLQSHLLALLRSDSMFDVFKNLSDGFTNNYDDGFICQCCYDLTAPFLKFSFSLNAGKRKSAFDELQKKCENKLVDILLLQEPALHKGKTLFLLNLSRNDLRVMMGVLTGHCCLYKHLNSMQRTQLINCRYCKGMTEETMQHVVASCDAHSRVRLRVFNHTVINAEELAEFAHKTKENKKAALICTEFKFSLPPMAKTL
ncbi:CLUMA_CG010718, isoform A [Clunio marinus]|uniref:CLUMA_CG010718, isoform A n=1 Tax=Clunio marinus TaxID=568069 RepID=A0A1J1ICP3_9DIPT|nr:CLUMA_CG010718, isoform A [Clunio marinus]